MDITITQNADGTGTVTIAGVPITPYTAPVSEPVTAPVSDPPTISTPPADSNEIKVEAIDPLDRVWTGVAHVGNDQTAPGVYCVLADASGQPHRALTMTAYSHCVDVGAARCDNPYDWVNFKSVRVWRNGVEIPVTPTNKRGTYDFWQYAYETIPFPDVSLAWNAAKIDRSVMPNYAPGVQAPTDNSKWICGWNGCAMIPSLDMGDTGDHEYIGFLPTWVTAFLTDPTQATFDTMLLADYAAGTWNCQVALPDTGAIIDVTQYPKASFLPSQRGGSGNPVVTYGGVMDGDTLMAAADAKALQKSEQCKWDEAHHVGFYFVTAMVTGSAWALDHASRLANAALTFANAGYRQQCGVFEHYQQRGTAWALRSLFLASYYSSDTAYFAARLEEQRVFADAHIGNNPFGMMATYYPDGDYNAWWQEGYMAIVFNAMCPKLPQWTNYARWLATSTVKFMDRLLYPYTTVYHFYPRDETKTWYPDVKSVLKAGLVNNHWTDAAGADAALYTTDPQSVFAAVSSFYATAKAAWVGQYANGYGDFMQYPDAPGAYPALMRVRSIVASDLGVSDVPWGICQNVPTKPNFSKDYRFNIVPRAA